MRLRLIFDNRTPRCLPKWACDEIVRLRLAECDLREEVSRLRVALAVANGGDRRDAITEEFNRAMAEMGVTRGREDVSAPSVAAADREEQA